MNEQKTYTVKELDELRRACESRWLFGTTNQMIQSNRPSRVYYEEEKASGVEALVRTHMAAGHVALDLYRADNENIK